MHRREWQELEDGVLALTWIEPKLRHVAVAEPDELDLGLVLSLQEQWSKSFTPGSPAIGPDGVPGALGPGTAAF
jgi:hypothetical protein